MPAHFYMLSNYTVTNTGAKFLVIKMWVIKDQLTIMLVVLVDSSHIN